MSIPEKLRELAGEWKGVNRLHTPWTDKPVRESESTAIVSNKANGQFLQIDYTWNYEGDAQQGVLILGCDKDEVSSQAVWTDSWHLANQLMLCDGVVGSGVDVKGYYQVPEHPDWGWRTQITTDGDTFTYKMFNVSPDGVEELAVETVFSRNHA